MTNKTNKTITEQLISLIRQLSEEEQDQLLHELKSRYPFYERREHKRMEYAIDVTFLSPCGQTFLGYIHNISVGGFFIEISNQSEFEDILSVGDEISIQIPQNNHTKYLKKRGRVVRIIKDGIGVQFI